MLYHHLPNWPEDRIRPLMETFGSMLMEQRVYSGAFRRDLMLQNEGMHEIVWMKVPAGRTQPGTAGILHCGATCKTLGLRLSSVLRFSG